MITTEDALVELLTERHPSTAQIGQFFKHSHLRPYLASYSEACCVLAVEMLALPDGPELTAGLRKLLEAKDCFVRAAMTA